MKQPNILIIGGGIGGLTLAVALKQLGISCTVFERATQLNPVGSGILLSINAVNCLKHLGLADMLSSLGFKLISAEIKNWEGTLIRHMNYDKYIQQYGVTNIGIARAELHQLLMKQIDQNALYLGRTFKSYEINANGTVTAHFMEGESFTGDIIIGADGIRSTVLQQMAGNISLRYHDYTSFRGLANIPYKKDEPYLFTEYWGRGHRFGMLRVNQEQVYWFVSYKMKRDYHFDNQSHMKNFLQEHYSNWASPIPELIEITKPEQIIKADIFDRKPSTQWYKGPVVLLGDSIHSTTPNLGQGAGIAIESAITLANCIKNFDPINAFQHYFNLRYDRTSWINKTSNLMGEMGLWENPTLCWLRNKMFYFMPQTLVEKQNQNLFSFDPYTLNTENK